MFDELIRGISAGLHSVFGEGYEIYWNDVEQGLQEPCFLISVQKPEIVPMLGKRSLRRNPFDIQYFPASPGSNAELFAAAEKMEEALLEIELSNGDRLRGTAISLESVDNVLHFFVQYNYFTLRMSEETSMETLESKVTTTGER